MPPIRSRDPLRQMYRDLAAGKDAAAATEETFLERVVQRDAGAVETTQAVVRVNCTCCGPGKPKWYASKTPTFEETMAWHAAHPSKPKPVVAPAKPPKSWRDDLPYYMDVDHRAYRAAMAEYHAAKKLDPKAKEPSQCDYLATPPKITIEGTLPPEAYIPDTSAGYVPDGLTDNEFLNLYPSPFTKKVI